MREGRGHWDHFHDAPAMPRAIVILLIRFQAQAQARWRVMIRFCDVMNTMGTYVHDEYDATVTHNRLPSRVLPFVPPR